MNIFRMASRLSTIKINSRLFGFTSKQGNFTSFILSSSTFHTSNLHTLHRKIPFYVFDVFEDITNIDDALTLFHDMLQNKPMPPIILFEKLFKVVAKMDRFLDVVVMFKKLTLLGCKVNEYTMTTVMNCYCKLREVDLGFAVLGNMIKSGYDPDIVSITCLIKGLFLKERVVEAAGLFKKVLVNKFCEVNVVTVSVVMDGLCKSGNLGDAVELLEMLEKRDIRLNVIVYNSIVDGLCKHGMLKEARDLLSRMIDRDVFPDVVTYTSFIHGLCNLNQLDFACALFNDLSTKKNVIPDVIAYTVMIQGFCREGMLLDIKEILDKMEGQGCSPNSLTCNFIIQACLKHRRKFDSIYLFKQIIERDFQLNARTYFLVLRLMQGKYHDDMIIRLKEKFFPSYNH